MKKNTDERIKNAQGVSKETLIEKIKTTDPTRFDQMLIESEERKNYFYVKYKALAYSREPKTLKFPLFKDLVNDFERNIKQNGEPEILKDDQIIQKIIAKGSNNIKKSDSKKESLGSKVTTLGTSLKNEKNLTSALGSIVKSTVNQVKENIEEKKNPNGYYTPKENNKYKGENLVFHKLPLITNNGKVDFSQPIYYIPNETERCTCNTCKGEMYTTCTETECRGQHIYDCNKCRTSGKLDCDDCNARGEYTCPSCHGRGSLTCSGCSGKGRAHCRRCTGNGYTSNGSRCPNRCNKGWTECSDCKGSGERKCSSVNSSGGLVGLGVGNLVSAGIKKAAGNEYCGGSGIIRCSKCSASGKITCDKCEGDGRIECETCYADHIDNRYGKVDCETCETAGELASISYIETEIKSDNLDLIFTDGKKIEAPNFGVETIKKFANANSDLVLTYESLNGENKENYDEYSDFCSKNAMTEIGDYKNRYPKLISEEVYYESVPCATFNYNHILSATFHDVSILSVDNMQEVFFHSNPADVAEKKESLKNKINELCKQAFSTKAFKDKIDRKHEMFLMVHMAKADGIIEEQEKRYLSQTISGLHGFTQKEKAELFGLMSATTLPAILPTNAYFSSRERAEDARKKIVELVAKADGEYEPHEKAKLEEINNAIELGYKAKPTALGRFFKTWQVSVSLFLLLCLITFGIIYSLYIYPQQKAEHQAKQQIEIERVQANTDSALNSITTTNSTSEERKNNDNPTKIVTENIISSNNDAESVILGTWVGEMSGKKLTIVIEKVNGNELIGYNILGTNRRNLKGTFVDGEWAQSCSKAFDATLNEPGDDKWDGVFTVKFVGYGDTNDETNECLGGKYQGTEGQGEWKSNNGKMHKDFSLTKQ